jgi:hypothetical protein
LRRPAATIERASIRNSSSGTVNRIMLNLVAALIALFVLTGAPMAVTAQTARTIEKTIACPTEEDFQGYLALLITDVSAATAYALDHLA